ncbi:MAG: DUF2062 domain-containing protein [Pseudomonadota bacterium]|nr:DUF2062 domain-containing protein [Pseudomonadota bacterium]
MTPRVLVAVPVYNHASTLRAVVLGLLERHPHVLVVDDGSDDLEPEVLAGLPVRMVRHGRNRGKGAAIRTAALEARRQDMSHIVTIDADGQHDPADLPLFLEAVAADPLAVIVGARDFNTENVPGSSRFGRAFSNFWLRVQTGVILSDVQSGYRAYPLNVLENLRCTENRYSFEVEVLVRAAWAGFRLREVNIRVHYPPKGERVSHFRAFMDNVRISLLNTRLTIRAIMPVPHRKFGEDEAGRVSPIHPLKSLRILLRDDATPAGLGLSAALGIFLGTLPLIGIHSIAILVAAGWLRWNKIAALAASQLCMPPLVPALCIEAGHYLRHGIFLTEISLRTLGYEAPQRLWEWILGSMLLAPLLAALIGAAVWVLARIVAAGLKP